MDHSLEEEHRCPAPRSQCIMNGRFQIRFYNLLSSSPDNLQFKTLPFQRIINEVVPPMYIRFGELMHVAGPNNTRNHFGAEFYLSVSDLQRMCLPNKGPNDSKQPIQLQIRIGEQLPGMQELSEVLPQPLIMCINNKPVPTDDIKSPLNVDAIDYLHLNTVNVNFIEAIWPQCKRIFHMVVYLVEIISVEELVDDIKRDNNRYFLALNTKKTAKKLLEKYGKDVSLGAYKFTLLCPINKLRMKLPARSVNCDHLQCFDLQAFISLNKIEPSWMCPICMNPCILADLKIDSFLLFIINSINVPKTCLEIELYANGKWKPCNLDSDSCEGVLGTSCVPSKTTVFEIDLGNSDDEGLDNFEKIVLPTANAGNSNDLKPNICIDPTLSSKETNTDEKPPLFKVLKKEETDS